MENLSVRILKRISSQVILQDKYPKPIKRVMGVDAAYFDDYAITSGIVLSWPEMEVIEKTILKRKVYFPYISGYFSFREGPLIIRLINI